jgi:glycosyltransferase involved in cell wall biosynthesis
MIDGRAWWVRLIQWTLGIAYRRCDTIADLGICMRRLLQKSRGDAVEDTDEADNPTATTAPWRSGRYATVVPWSLVEPASVVDPDAAVRRELFGDSRLGLLYSGNFGRAHSYEMLLELARRLRGRGIGFCFAGRGMRMDQIRSEVTPADDNIRFAGFADESQLSLRLAAADVHLVSLRPTWTGTVVPSKFFGALAAGRPVLFAGDSQSAIARWVTRHEIGWVLTDDTIDAVAAGIPMMADDPISVMSMRQRCFDVYHREFSRSVQMRRWKTLLEDAADE